MLCIETADSQDSSLGLDAQISHARQLIQKARTVVVISGAGISAESGVPTFRGTGETWRGFHFMELANIDMFRKNPRLVWDWYLYRRNVVAACEPNAAHRALAAFEQRLTRVATVTPEGRSYLRGLTVITQNVDGLHERAGSTEVIRLHGNLWANRCVQCGREREDRALFYRDLPQSPCCGAPERPAIVWFGEALDDRAYSGSVTETALADVVIVVGTSGTVMPAALLVGVAKKLGHPLIEVNPVPGQFPANLFDIQLRMPAAQALPLIFS